LIQRIDTKLCWYHFSMRVLYDLKRSASIRIG
jgi:hypothetical protein